MERLRSPSLAAGAHRSVEDGGRPCRGVSVDDARRERPFPVRWSSEIDAPIDAFDASGAVVPKGEGRVDSWSFRIGFPDHAGFYRRSVDGGIPIDVAAGHDTRDAGTDDGFGLADAHRTAPDGPGGLLRRPARTRAGGTVGPARRLRPCGSDAASPGSSLRRSATPSWNGPAIPIATPDPAGRGRRTTHPPSPVGSSPTSRSVSSRRDAMPRRRRWDTAVSETSISIASSVRLIRRGTSK